MPSALDIVWAIAIGPLWWYAGAVFFDFVHWVLHVMLRSRLPLVRALAWPHSVHHQWIDARLEVCWENQTRNIWCHIVPEYLTQLAFSAAVALIQPVEVVVVLVAMQTIVFGGILHSRGLDPNHRPIQWLDAYRPGFHTPPAYHALHHVYPDAYFSAYTKWIDWLVAGGTQIAGRRFAFAGAQDAFAAALRDGLVEAGAEVRTWNQEGGAALLAESDVLVQCEPDASATSRIERFIAATRERQLPPEVWSVHTRANDPTARHYHCDPRVNHRTILARDPAALDSIRAHAAARTALSGIRRGFNFVPTRFGFAALREYRRFRRTPASPPPGSVLGRRRELAGPVSSGQQTTGR